MRKIKIIIILIIAIISGVLAAILVGIQYKANIPKKVKYTIPVPKTKNVSPEKIPLDMRVVPIKVDVSSCLKLKDGDKVDIIAISSIPELNNIKVSWVLLSNIEVYKVTQENNKFIKLNNKKQIVYFLVTPFQAAVLCAAEKSTDIKVALRNNSGSDSIKRNKEKPVPCVVIPGKKPIILNPKSMNPPISTNIPVGMRAVTIKVKETDGICGRLKPGDHVDIVVTCPFSKFASSGDISPGAKGVITQYRMSSTVVLQDILILDTDIKSSLNPYQKTTLVTLLVRPEEAATLSVINDATQKSKIRLILRNPKDRKKGKIPRIFLSDILSEKKVYSEIKVIKGTKIFSHYVFK